jgi:hypothetical protein
MAIVGYLLRAFLYVLCSNTFVHCELRQKSNRVHVIAIDLFNSHIMKIVNLHRCIGLVKFSMFTNTLYKINLTRPVLL